MAIVEFSILLLGKNNEINKLAGKAISVVINFG